MIVFEINKGVNKEIEFRGLKAQYVAYLAAGLVGLLILFAAAYIAGVPVYFIIPTVGILGFLLFTYVYKFSHKYGAHGLMKKIAFGKVPTAIVCRDRKIFTSLSK
ncbi:DUF4133 domain-containing protein [Chitinophaga varians]|uniref:DUF4133 domain-containing protein n=1 Tax=Chitinophaga varians TaxID=2202339 RepID=A0A847S391_9BACT|nr:DUF4133 domain-containing protein [Chitinophaga varians]NLR67905.1 DUF4133 domain-containing protein [Chitinophaga varians]